MKSIKSILALALVVVSLCAVALPALADCPGGNPNCPGRSWALVRHEGLEFNYDYACSEHPNCRVYVFGYPWGYSCLTCGEWYRNGEWDNIFFRHSNPN